MGREQDPAGLIGFWSERYKNRTAVFAPRIEENDEGEETLEQKLTFVIPPEKEELDEGIETCFPLRELGLFRKFAGLNPNSNEEMAHFASEWGCLKFSAPKTSVRLIWTDESLELWQDQVSRMKAAVWILDRLRDEDEEALSRLWNLESNVIPQLHPSYADEFFSDVRAFQPHPEWESIVFAKSYFFLRDCINFELLRHQLSMFLVPAFPVRSTSQPMRLTFYPDNLLGALWLQLAQFAAGEKRFTTCAKCGDPIEISLYDEGKREGVKYCSPKCRQAAYRLRKKNQKTANQ